MKNATLLLGAALLLASIVAAKSDMLRCGSVIVETEHTHTCSPGSPSGGRACLPDKFKGFSISNLPMKGETVVPFELNLKVTKEGTFLATFNGKRCRDPHEQDPR